MSDFNARTTMQIGYAVLQDILIRYEAGELTKAEADAEVNRRLIRPDPLGARGAEIKKALSRDPCNDTTQASPLRIYLASSWRNPHQPELVRTLRAAGHEVYDFRNPEPGDTGFSWSAIDPDWLDWTPAQFRDALTHPLAEHGFAHDLSGMEWANVCVLALPCGKSAHLEAGWFTGRGLPVFFYIPEDNEPELMYKLGGPIVTTQAEILKALSAHQEEAAQQLASDSPSVDQALTKARGLLRSVLDQRPAASKFSKIARAERLLASILVSL